MSEIVVLDNVEWIKPEAAERLLGLTSRSVHSKIQRGVWECGVEYQYDPDGYVWINLEGLNRWIANSQRVSGRGKNQSGSPSRGAASSSKSTSRGGPRTKTSSARDVSQVK